MRPFWWLFFLSVMVFGAAAAQNTLVVTDADRDYQKGLDLLQKDQLGTAQQAFEKYLALTTDPEHLRRIAARYYAAHCALRLKNPDGIPRMYDFMVRYPESNLLNDVYYDVGTWYFDKNDLDSTITYFERVNLSQLDDDRAREARFKLGYGYFAHQQFEKALPYFDYLKTGEHRYSYASYYYSGYANYRQKDYAAALRNLEKAGENEAYQPLVPLLIANIYYEQKDYDRLITYATELEQSGTRVRDKNALTLLIGTAYYEKKEYPSAVEKLQEYVDKTPAARPDAHYRLGYARFQLKLYQEAIGNFKVVVERKDSLADFATYYLGMSYLMTGQKAYAVNAFKESKEKAPNTLIREESLYNYGKLQLELQQYSQGIDALKTFRKEFPNSRHIAELDDLLSKAYLLTNDYEAAIGYIESIPRRSEAINEVYQKVAFTKASLLFNEGEFDRAITFLKKSTGSATDRELEGMAYYWLGEAYYQQKEWEQAEAAYKRVFSLITNKKDPVYLQAQYGIGHLYFHKKNYETALEHYREVVAGGEGKISKKMYADALERLADCYFVLRNFTAAIAQYNKAYAMASGTKDYIIYQRGVAYSKNGEYLAALDNFNAIISSHRNSPYYEAAYYKKGELQLNNRKNQEAATTFTGFINKHPHSRFVPYALFRRILAYRNINEDKKAEQDIIRFVENYPSHEKALDALHELPSESSEYARLSKLIKNADPSSVDQLVQREYQRARSDYYSGKYDMAAEKLEQFVEDNPESTLRNEAQKLAADAFYKAEKWDKAKKHYIDIIENNRDDQLNLARHRVAQIAERQGQPEEAIRYYQQLRKHAADNQERYNAQAGLLDNYMQAENYDSVWVYARKMLDQPNLTLETENKASLFAGRAAYALDKKEAAADYFIITANGAKDAYGAEAAYMLAFMEHEKAAWDQSVEMLRALIKTYNRQVLWIGKAYLLIAANYRAMGEAFQAEATAKSLLEFPEPSIAEEARQRLDAWEKEDRKEEGDE